MTPQGIDKDAQGPQRTHIGFPRPTKDIEKNTMFKKTHIFGFRFNNSEEYKNMVEKDTPKLKKSRLQILLLKGPKNKINHEISYL